jgi:acetyl-CoA carboxylase biotin carboxyl carrier protein
VDFKDRIDELAAWMDEFHLAEAELELGGAMIRFRKRPTVSHPLGVQHFALDEPHVAQEVPPVVSEEPEQAGNPVTSPMTGIYYDAPSPTSAPFVKVGDTVSAGQIIALIEAMKVFNEIPCTLNGTVLGIALESGQIVQPGDVLLWVG